MAECSICNKFVKYYHYVNTEITSKKLFCSTEVAEDSPCYEFEQHDDYINVRHVCKCNQLVPRKLKIKIRGVKWNKKF
jgi:hypothetical protein